MTLNDRRRALMGMRKQSSDPVLLASVALSEPQSFIQIDHTDSMDSYSFFVMEIEGNSSGTRPMYLCPQINGTSGLDYNGSTNAGVAFHRKYAVAPIYNTSGSVNGYSIPINTGKGVSSASAPISFFYIRSYYSDVLFTVGTTMKIWGIG